MKKYITKRFRRWRGKVWRRIKKNTIRSIFIILVLPYFMFFFAKLLIYFSVISAVGYVFACVYGFTKILEDPYRIIKWAFAYLVSAFIIHFGFALVLPQIEKNTPISVFSGLVILYILFMLWWKLRKIKKS